MNRWLPVALLVASVGGTFSLYTAISVGSTGLTNLAANLQPLSVVLNNYYTSLNTNRALVNATLNDFGYFVNVTYAALNKTYGATQPSVASMMYQATYFNQTLQSGESMVNSQIASDLSQMSYNVQQIIDNIFQSFSSSLYTMSSYDQQFTQDKCVAKNMTQMALVPNSLSKLAPCLQQEVNTANAITPIIVSTIKMLKNDLQMFLNLQQICQPTSTTCLDQYFSGLSMDFSTVQSSLNMVSQYISSAQQDAYNRNRICGDLVRYDVQDAISNLQSTVSSCSYPQM